jgi:hypothetical protein
MLDFAGRDTAYAAPSALGVVTIGLMALVAALVPVVIGRYGRPLTLFGCSAA